MSNDQRLQYTTAATLTQEFLDASQDNLVNQLELIVDIERPDGGFIHASDRNKYVGGVFYEALLTFPVIKRTIGEFLSPTLEFSNLELELNNVDGRLNQYLPSGDDFDGWIGNEVIVKLGLKDISSTYRTVFEGFITDQGGFKRTVKSIVIIARDKFDSINVNFPQEVFTKGSFPDLEDDKDNLVVPIIYGDWTTNVEPQTASVPAVVVNGNNANVNGDTDNSQNVQLVIAAHALGSFDTSNVYLRRGEKWWRVDSGDISSVNIGGPGVSSFEIAQESAVMVAITPDTDDQTLKFGRGDEFFVRVTGKNLGIHDDNIISQAKDILETYGSVAPGDFDSSWNAYRDKTSPAVSAIANIKSRVYINEPQNTLEFALSLLEQVRLEAFVDRNLKLNIVSLHLDDFEADPDFNVSNWDVEQGSFQLQIDERTNINRAGGVYNFLPNRKENFQETGVYRNNAAITQAGKTISKRIVFPNLYVASDVENQLKETLRITSAYIENVNMNLTWRSMLLDIGDFVKLNVQIQSTVLENIPALIREIGYDPEGIKIPMRVWSLQMLPFPGWSPGYPGITGGSTATITLET